MKLWRVGRLMIGVVSCLVLRSVADTPHIDPLRNVELQSLPAGICGVVVGPDDTVWCEAAVDEAVPVASGRERIKQQLREQWGRPMPCLTGAKPVLFQKSGRIWFVCKWVEKTGWGETLLGFDGKDFVEPAGPTRVIGVASESASDDTTARNVEFAGTAYFVTERGIARVDDGKLVEEPLMAPGREIGIWQLLVTSDGKGLRAVGFDPKAKKPMIWRYEAGKWSMMELPTQLWSEFMETRVLPLGADHVLFYCNPRNEAAELGTAAVSPLTEDPSVDASIKQLGEGDFAKRQAAVDQLLAGGPLLIGRLSTALGAATDPEIKARLDAIIKQYKKVPASAQLGPYTVQGIRGAQGDAKGRAFIYAAGVTEKGRALGDGLIIGDGQTWDFLPNDTALDGIMTPIPHSEAEYSGLVCGDDLWICDGRAGRPAGYRRVDFQKRSLAPALPRSDLEWIFGRQKNGVVYAGVSDQGATGNAEVVVYRPGAPTENRLLPAITSELWGPLCAGDGKVWAYSDALKALVVFDGTAWKSRTKVPSAIESFCVGTGDTVIAFTRQQGNDPFAPQEAAAEAQVLLITPKEVYTAKDIQTLVQEHTKEIAAAFRATANQFDSRIVADGDGNIWFRDGQILQVFTGGDWITVIGKDAKKPLVRMIPTDGVLALLLEDEKNGMPVFDGVTASIKDGKPALEPWPKSPHFVPETSQQIKAVRQGDVPQDFSDHLKFNDGVGNIWADGDQDSQAKLFHAGQMIGPLRVPGLPQDWQGATDESGNVFLLTSLGLQYWAYDKSLPGTPFARRGIFTIATMPKEVLSINYSSLGYVVIWGMTEKPPGVTGGMYRHDVVLVKVSDMKQAAGTRPANGGVTP